MAMRDLSRGRKIGLERETFAMDIERRESI
jgi:hypothetical protein